jgi:ABC-type transport system involved in multi-copper enzyme maturation permease subunit
LWARNHAVAAARFPGTLPERRICARVVHWRDFPIRYAAFSAWIDGPAPGWTLSPPKPKDTGMQLWAIIVDSFRESLDRKIFWVLVAMTLVVTLAMASIGFEGDRVSLLFGMVTTTREGFDPLTNVGRSNLVGLVIYLIASTTIAYIGIILMIIATAGVFPAFMERGAIDIVLSKPISRPRVFLYKYFATMVFVMIQAGLFFGLTFLVMGVRWHVWAPGYLLCIPLLVLLFSYLYCVTTLVAVTTRSTLAAVLITIVCWAVFAVVHQAPSIFEAFPELKERRALYHTVRILSWIPPKTGDYPYLAAKWAQAGTSVDAMMFFLPGEGELEAGDREELALAREVEERELLKSPAKSIGSSLLFEAVVLGLAMWRFSRKDF